ncbi:OmpA family protein [Tenacibaculum finnmarkense]|nr:OmpA family protein [Tenacibaculum finnmarkense]
MPEVAGVIENKGCPWKDTDGDTILDKDDTCPELAGTPENNGCPDTDKDGISDDKDACKDLAGPLENNGCPWSDTDKDGVSDKDDKCPTVAGLLEKQGCPEVVITKAAKAKLDEFARAIYFNSGKSTFKPGVASKLDLMAKIMQEYATAKFNIEGHTDSAGSAVTNQRFSDKRAKAVLDYLVKTAGIKADRLTSVGYGENNPISTNKTRAGRAENRRVEIKLVK